MKNQPICVSVPCQPYAAPSAPSAASQIASPATANAMTFAGLKRVCGSTAPSSMSAGPKDAAADPCPSPRNRCGSRRPHTYPTAPAVRTIAGNGTSKAKIATKAAALISQSGLYFSARDPIRYAAKRTIAVTAGFMPWRIAATHGTSPKRM